MTYYLFTSDAICRENRHGLFGVIQSPNFPDTYPDNLHCEWNITVPAGHRVRIRFTVIDVEYFYMCDYDWISLRSGNSTLGKFCGSNKTNRTHHKKLPKEYSVSPTNQVTLTFHTDYSNEEPYSGFRAHYIAVGEQLDSLSFIHPSIHPSIHLCTLSLPSFLPFFLPSFLSYVPCGLPSHLPSHLPSFRSSCVLLL